jgi:hypothetical protein
MNYLSLSNFYLLAFSTLQGSRMVSPATNLNVSERDIKLGSGAIRGECELTVKRKEKISKKNQFLRQFFIRIKVSQICRKSISIRVSDKVLSFLQHINRKGEK